MKEAITIKIIRKIVREICYTTCEKFFNCSARYIEVVEDLTYCNNAVRHYNEKMKKNGQSSLRKTSQLVNSG